MPLQYKLESDLDIELSIWKVTEPISYFQDKFEIHQPEELIIRELKNRKKLEWYSSRYLLHLMSGRHDRGQFIKDIHGKPHLISSDHHISISHSKQYVSVMASKLLIGIDIQSYVSKITRIQHKFVSEYESRFIKKNNIETVLHIIWGAKESLYKAYGKRGLDFKKHLLITELDTSEQTGFFKGTISIEDYNKEFILNYQLFKEYILVYAKESI